MNSLYFVSVFVISIASAEISKDSAFNALNKFALKFLEETSNDLPEDTNIAISPYTIWIAMAILNEGARANTADELERTLGIPPEGRDRTSFRVLQQHMIQKIKEAQDGVTLEAINSVFTKKEAKLNSTFQELVRHFYDVDVEPLDFSDVARTTRYINEKMYSFTRGRVPEIINEDAVRNAEMFITSALFFKGLWDKRFDKANTREQPFYNEQRQVIGSVSMMRNNGTFPFAARILNGKANAVELPYKGNRMSMIVLLPNGNTLLSSVLRELTTTPITSILTDLYKARDTYGDVDIKIYLPKFSISSDLILNDVLRKMGIKDAFDASHSVLSGISEKELLLSNVIHKAKIEVDEDGTVGAAVTEVELIDKSGPVNFKADRPFAFFVVDKVAHTVVLMGKISKPNTIVGQSPVAQPAASQPAVAQPPVPRGQFSTPKSIQRFQNVERPTIRYFNIYG